MPKYFIQNDDGSFEELIPKNATDIQLDNSPTEGTLLFRTPSKDGNDNTPKTTTQEQKQLGVIMPLYVHPDINYAAWVQIASIAKKYPRLRVVVVVDVSAGPGLGPDPSIQRAIGMLKNQGVTVLGRIITSNQDEGRNKNEITRWVDWYNNIDGFYFDFVPREQGHEDFYREMDEFAKKQLGVKMTVAAFSHTDAPVLPESLVRTTNIDVFILDNDKGIPNPPHNVLLYKINKPWMNELPRSKFGMIITGIESTADNQTLVDNFIREAVGTRKLVGYVYIQTDSGARKGEKVFDNLSSLFESTLIQLDQIAHAEDPTRRIPEPNQPFTDNPATVGGGLPSPISRGDETGLEPPTEDRDAFGVQKLYPDARGKKFQQWLFKQDRDATKDKRLKIPLGGLRRMQDGSDAWWFSGEMMVASESKDKKWLNTESTIYVCYLDELDAKTTKLVKERQNKGIEQYLYQFLARTGLEHSDKKPCEGSCYKSRIMRDGSSVILREFAHGFYSDNKAVQRAILHELKGQWYGFKQVIYNLNEDGNRDADGKAVTYVMIENWVDDNCTDQDGNLVIRNNWKRISRYMDTGSFVLRDRKLLKKLAKTKCKVEEKQILNTPGGNDNEPNYVGFKADRIMAKVANFSIRSIDEPRAD